MTVPDVATPILRIIITLALLAGSVPAGLVLLEEVESAWKRKDWLKFGFHLFLLISVAILFERLVSPYVNL